MHDNTYIQTITKNFPRSRECEPSILGTFVRLNVLDYKRTEQSDHRGEVFETALSYDKLRVHSLGESNE